MNTRPLESLCAELDTAEEIYPIIEKFVAQIKNYQQSRKNKKHNYGIDCKTYSLKL